MELLSLLLGLLLATPLATGIMVIPLDMAPNAFDDQYKGCREQMMRQLPKLNRTEFAKNNLLAKHWAMAPTEWQKFGWSRLRPEQVTALRVFTMDTSGLYKEFNEATREGGRSRQEYLENFDFKVLHFLITEAVHELRDPINCFNVYRGVRGVQFTAKPGDIIRFGQFTSSSVNKDRAEGFGTDTFFEIHTCHGANIEEFSAFTEEEVLIPPFETFEVTSVTQKLGTTRIHLESHGVHSNYNCALLRGSSVQRDTPHLGGLLLAALALALATGTP